MTESTFGNQCLDQTLCQQVEYSLKTRITPAQSLDGESCPVGNSCLDLYYDNPYVEKIVTEAGYSFQSLVGEVGGTIGMTFGLSGLALSHILIKTLRRFRWSNFIKRVFILLFVSLYVYWTTLVLVKYFEEPSGTRASFQISNMTQEFPALTFCLETGDLYSNDNNDKLIYAQQKPFHHMLEEDLRANMSINMSEYTDLLTYNIKDYIHEPYIITQGQKIYLTNDDIWIPVFDRFYGLCYTLDIRKDEKLEMGTGPVTFGCKPPSDTSMQASGIVLMHDVGKLQSAERSLAKTIQFDIIGNYFVAKDYNIRKEKFSSVSLKSVPCGKEDFYSCKESHIHEMILNDYKCQIPTLMSEVTFFENISYPICDSEITLVALEIMMEDELECSRFMPCEWSR